MNTYIIVVIGGGPAGMIAAIRAAQLTDKVAIFEKNASLGRKLSLTGRGRCNITNTSQVEEFLRRFGKNGQFLRNAFAKFFTDDLINFFEERGLKLKVERQGRVFPQTDKSFSVIDILEKELKERGVEIKLSSPVRSVEVYEDGLKGVILNSGEKIRAQKVIIATGGSSYPETGSTGDGYKIASRLTHKIEDIYPGLVPLETQEHFVKELQGLTLKNIRCVFESDVKKIESPVGEILFTHFGISGPLVLDLSSDVCLLLKQAKSVKALIDLKPGVLSEELDLKLQRELQSEGALKIKNYLCELLPKRLIDVVLKLSGVSAEKKCHQVNFSERMKIVSIIKEFPLTIKGARPVSEAMVTCGGVSLKDVNPKTMESKKIKGLYFCGEILDIAASSGGFNLQAAFSTGYIAGEAACESLI